MKMKVLLLTIAWLTTSIVNAQHFEGKIVYQNSFKSKVSHFSDTQLTEMMGTTQQYFIKKGNYRSETNGNFFQWQMYIQKENKLYSKLSIATAIYWSNAEDNDDPIIKVDVNRKVTTIFGHACDEVVIKSSKGTHKFYFNAGVLQVDATLYTKHKFHNWDEYLGRANALPLKVILDEEQFFMESVVTEITPQTIDDKIFELPAGAELQKNPY